MADPIRFDRSLYLPEAVTAAAAAYADHARIDVRPADDAIHVTLADPVGVDEHTLVHAFCNHVLYETITRHRQTALDTEA